MMSRPQSYIEGGTPDSQHAKSNRGSKVTSERVALLVLGVLLAAALIVIYRLLFENMRTKEILKNLEDHRMKCDKNLTETLSKIKQCSTVQPTCLTPEVRKEPCSKCEEGWEKHGGKCYYFTISKSSWNNSRDQCKTKGGNLVKIDSVDEQAFLERSLRDKMSEDEDKFWIGLTDSAVEGRWLWVDGSQLDESLKFWSGNEPDNWNGTAWEYPDGEDCVKMGEKGGAEDLKCWFDAACSKPHKSICEKPAVPGDLKCV